MKRFLVVCCFVVFVAQFVWADGNVRIDELGFGGHCLFGKPCSVLVTLSNPKAKDQSFELHVGLLRQSDRQTVFPDSVYVHRVSLAPGEERQLELPVQTPNWLVGVDITAKDADGNIVGHQVSGDSQGWLGSDVFISVLCDKESVCKRVASKIQLSAWMEAYGSRPEVRLRTHPRYNWWAYSASAIVVAMPTSAFTGEQRLALELFARHGGRLILVEDEIADPAFLSAYRTGTPNPEGVRIGTGHLYRVPKLKSRMLEKLCSGYLLREIVDAKPITSMVPDSVALQTRYATRFHFPSLWTLVLWVAAYIIVVGVVNFSLLRRLRRQEWGWVTVTAVAVLFVAGLYWFASRQKPRKVTLDNVAIHFLDSHSGLAVGDYGTRMSVPRKGEFILRTTPGGLLLPRVSEEVEIHRLENVRIGKEITREWTADAPVRLSPVPGAEIKLPMARWTSSKLHFTGHHEFAGSVPELSPGRFRNDTGRTLSNVIYVDTAQNSLWMIGNVAPGGEFNLAQIGRFAIWEKSKIPTPDVLSDAPPFYSGPYKLVSPNYCFRVQGPLTFGYEQVRLLCGLSDGPARPVELPNSDYIANEHALIVVMYQ